MNLIESGSVAVAPMRAEERMDGVFACASSWAWAFRCACERHRWSLRQTQTPAELPGYDRASQAVLRLQLAGQDQAVHLTAGAFDALGHKDELARVFMADAELRALIPASTVVRWDAASVRDVALPIAADGIVVLKPPLGCQGEGIEFLRGDCRQHVLETVQRDASNARAEPGFLNGLRARLGRLSGWVVQAHVASMLTSGGRKFHARAYVFVDCAAQTI